MDKISLIALDIGGTLLCDNNTITSKNLEAIKFAKQKGILIALATAREFSSTIYISKQISSDYGVFSNGSHLLDINKLKSLKYSILNRKAVLEIYNYCKKKQIIHSFKSRVL